MFTYITNGTLKYNHNKRLITITSVYLKWLHNYSNVKHCFVGETEWHKTMILRQEVGEIDLKTLLSKSF